ncbi:MAG: phosphoribosylformylglycinamidine synthase [Clostridiales bacterium]|nr:phosphoribosylformylglycinamidine synthase [Clostridiales bacterium]
MVYRIFVEKLPGFDVEAQSLCAELKENLSLKNLQSVRIVNRYDVEGIDEATYESARFNVFGEAAVDAVTDETLDLPPRSKAFAVEYLPGQYDQRADSAAQCIRLINTAAEPVVKYAKVIILSGNVTEADLEAVKNYYINPVDSQEASPEKPETLEMDLEEPKPVDFIKGFIEMGEIQLDLFGRSQGFAMSKEDLAFVQSYFKEEGRDPSVTELKVIDTYWSDHCRHTTFNTKITEVDFEDSPYGRLVEKAFAEYLEMRKEVYGDKEKPVCLMDMAVIGTKYLKKQGLVTDLDESEEVNACSINVKANIDGEDQDWLVMFKNETHNHPTEIEPFGGAATCLGGAIRDPLSGRSYVYQAMRVTGSGDPRTSVEDTLAGKLPQQKITRGAAKGYSSYGNQIGLATGQVTEIFNEGYIAKRMEVGAVIAAAPKENVIREVPQPGDVIILAGGRTGRDGCGGATGSSKEHTEDSILSCGAEVQKGNPPVERNLQRLFRRKEAATLIKRCNDFGAGGVSVAIGELADSLDINLDLVLKKYEGLDGTELAISESQERMAVVVAAEDADKFMEMAREENLESVVVAKVTDTGRVKMTWKGDTILDLSREFLNTNGVQQKTKAFVEMPVTEALDELQKEKEIDSIKNAVADLNCCSQKGLIEMFDSTIGAGTVLMPLGGKNQLTPALGMAAKLPVTSGYTDTATLMTFGFDPELSSKSPYHGALYAVVDSAAKITAMGGDYSKIRLSFQEYFEKLGSDPERWGKPLAALLGSIKAQKELGIPSIGGKDSMSGTFMDIHVPPTLISFAVTAADANNIISPEFKEAGSTIVLIDTEKDEEGVINFDKFKAGLEKVQQLIKSGAVISAQTIGKGGIFAAVSKMCLGNYIGAKLTGMTREYLLDKNYGALILEVKGSENADALFADVKDTVDHKVLGTTVAAPTINFEVRVDMVGTASVSYTLDELEEIWEAPLEGTFPSVSKEYNEEAPESISYTQRNTVRPLVKTAKPRVFIPVFPGTNCEVDSKRAFEKAGAETYLHILRNLTSTELEDSIKRMAKEIKNSQMIMIPGGFSGGDEPEGSAKFITAVFRNPAVFEAVTDLLENRDGLMLGICNGFQALIKLGLVPYGKIVDMQPDSPTLTYNSINRHVSTLVQTRIASVKSPWMANVEAGDVFTIPVSHGEGRFIASPEMLEQLKANGQIATQYADFEGKASNSPYFNPNNSDWAIEGITSPDGRVFGKMGHSERIGMNLYKNVLGEMDQKIFESGVQYFK